MDQGLSDRKPWPLRKSFLRNTCRSGRINIAILNGQADRAADTCGSGMDRPTVARPRSDHGDNWEDQIGRQNDLGYALVPARARRYAIYGGAHDRDADRLSDRAIGTGIPRIAAARRFA